MKKILAFSLSILLALPSYSRPRLVKPQDAQKKDLLSVPLSSFILTVDQIKKLNGEDRAVYFLGLIALVQIFESIQDFQGIIKKSEKIKRVENSPNNNLPLLYLLQALNEEAHAIPPAAVAVSFLLRAAAQKMLPHITKVLQSNKNLTGIQKEIANSERVADLKGAAIEVVKVGAVGGSVYGLGHLAKKYTEDKVSRNAQASQNKELCIHASYFVELLPDGDCPRPEESFVNLITKDGKKVVDTSLFKCNSYGLKFKEGRKNFSDNINLKIENEPQYDRTWKCASALRELIRNNLDNLTIDMDDLKKLSNLLNSYLGSREEEEDKDISIFCTKKVEGLSPKEKVWQKEACLNLASVVTEMGQIPAVREKIARLEAESKKAELEGSGTSGSK